MKDRRNQKPAEIKGLRGGFAIPHAWTRRGVVLERQPGDKGVSGDPCIVWDEAIIPPGAENAFDSKHTDAVTGYYFSERKEFLYFYMGYPRKAQPRKISPFGSAQAVAAQKLGEKVATKRGVILEPCQQAGHWASGWVGGLQLLRGAEHRWADGRFGRIWARLLQSPGVSGGGRWVPGRLASIQHDTTSRDYETKF